MPLIPWGFALPVDSNLNGLIGQKAQESSFVLPLHISSEQAGSYLQLKWLMIAYMIEPPDWVYMPLGDLNRYP